MALAATKEFKDFLVKLGDGATPTEVFAQPCGFLSRSLQLNKTFSENAIPDCSDEAAASWMERQEATKSVTISGQGVLDTAAFDDWNDWWFAGGSKNCQVVLTGVGQYAGAFVLISFQLSAEKGGKVSVNVEMQSDGAVTWTDA